jgi:K+/H+ antiporter YhaU regulatory subunit KhtT
MQNEMISVSNTESGQTMDVLVFDKRASQITVVIGEGVHSMKCNLTPTKNEQAYVGSVLGREIIYHCSREQVQSELDEINPAMKKSRTFK